MNGAAHHDLPHGRAFWVKLLAGVAVVALLLVLLAVFFPWDVLRGPLNRYVSDKTGRHFEITRRLDVKLGRTTRILADGIEFANPDWAENPHLVKAESAEIQIELLPLLRRRIVLPLVAFEKPQLGLQMEPDGRRSWALGRDTKDPGNIPEIGALVVDQGTMHFVAAEHGAEIRTEFAVDGPLAMKPGSTTGSAPEMPLRFSAKGTWQKEPFTAIGRTGNVLYLSAPLQQPFPAQVEASAANTTLRARGTIASLATLDGADAEFTLQGRNLQELYQLVGVVLPATPRYSVQGRLAKQGDVWHARGINGKLGNSDLHGDLAFDRSRPVPLLTGTVESKSLDFADLAPLVGLPEQARSAGAGPQVKGQRRAPERTAAASRAGDPRVLPTAPLDLTRLRRMDSDVTYRARKITHVKQLPLEQLDVHVRLKDGVLLLDPLKVGLAGGSVAGRVRIDGAANPAKAQVRLDARSLSLAKLFPGAKLTEASVGRIHGDIDLTGRGNSVAQLLAGSSGKVAFLTGSGLMSNLLLEIAGIDGAEIIKFFTGGDQNVRLRCGAASFDVKDGLMSSSVLVLDTTDTVIYGSGEISLRNEAMDITLRPYPKDVSILSLRSPLKIGGTFGAPRAAPDKGALAGRAALAVALGAVNPLLALAATVETGPGEDANCGLALREAASPDARARIADMNAQLGEKKQSLFGRVLGGSAGDRADPAGKAQAPASEPPPQRRPEPGAPADGGERVRAPGAPDRPYGP